MGYDPGTTGLTDTEERPRDPSQTDLSLPLSGGGTVLRIHWSLVPLCVLTKIVLTDELCV